ncbi:sn-glycerol-1-phosphate dehydrogenase [Alkalihalobacillus trypoxylicola]|uniref:Glycerol-1-phosphate dehydrogenase n=1 Tax=Alkalihalobacillus trypoxylicola TaxID=519424 RepID=A0A162F5S5_9BACI|nr:sn-glycerol-1-phosphate dehydrogenase [Alkalihalobacillus trypoxylicola]KYG34848.1 hypothetical protein AZF04_00495 [Alkalihalobacillus trypoxylicola]
MNINALNELGKQETSLNLFSIQIEKLIIDEHAVEMLLDYVSKKSYRTIKLITDANIWNLYGQDLVKRFNQDHLLPTTIIAENKQGDVVADERAIMQALLETPNEVDVFIALGSGTIHDITRIASYKMKVPFISVPTAPSVDGFNSMGAPLIINEHKVTYQTQAPIALFAPLAWLKDAPKEMIAAGFGDMLGKITSLADWTFGHLSANEPYSEIVANMTRHALNRCLDSLPLLMSHDEKGIKILMESLVESGLAMLMLGQSHPASGGEHHLSHYWEMDFIKQNKKQVLHGTKVAIATLAIIEYYKKNMNTLIENDEMDESSQKEIEKLIAKFPDPKLLKRWIEEIGGKTSIADISVSPNLFEESLSHAHTIRNRYTMLRYINENKK